MVSYADFGEEDNPLPFCRIVRRRESIQPNTTAFLMFLPACPAPDVAFLSHFLKFVGKFLQLIIGEMLDVDHLIMRLINRLNDLIEFQVNGACVPVLRILD